MSVQDDSREIEVRNLFGLSKPVGANRGDTDAELLIDGVKIDFELKSTTTGNVTTVRDFSMDHVNKWRDKHWIIGVYDRRGQKLKYCIYGSPTNMSDWIEEKAEYIRPDIYAAQLLPDLLDKNTLYKILGKKAIYSYKDAKLLQKKQYNKQQYFDKMDLDNGYTEDRMLLILQDRIKYLIMRGSTLNNPHIPASYFMNWPKITQNHNQILTARVREYLK